MEYTHLLRATAFHIRLTMPLNLEEQDCLPWLELWLQGIKWRAKVGRRKQGATGDVGDLSIAGD